MQEGAANSSLALRRAFVRAVLRKKTSCYHADAQQLAQAIVAHAATCLQHCTAELPRLRSQSSGPIDWASIYLTAVQLFSLPDGVSNRQAFAVALRTATAAAVADQAAGLRSAAVAEWTLRLRVSDEPNRVQAWRITVLLPTGHELGEDSVSILFEDTGDSAGPVLRPISPQPSPNASSAPPSLLQPVPPLEPLQRRRLHARRHATTYCYDFPAVFENALRAIWSAHTARNSTVSQPAVALVQTTELVLDASALAGGDATFAVRDAPLRPVSRAVGLNDVGTVVWLLELRTPEWPQGRQIVVVANDITHGAGAFGPREHAVFRAACDHAVAQRLPLVYLAANSGARVGLDQSLKKLLKVRWAHTDDPTRGFQYLYLSDADYQQCLAKHGAAQLPFTAVHEPACADAEAHWRLTDIIGKEDGLGVECLSGSGAIASAFSRAYDSVFTATLVSGRTVGIGAYLARLGHRVVQRSDQPIILTGYQALNKLLGRDIYTSQLQLGGPQVMAANGVSHLAAHDDLDGVTSILQWLAFTPRAFDAGAASASMSALPADGPCESTDRPMTYEPASSGRFDVRAAITGELASGGDASLPQRGSGDARAGPQGLFDRGSWLEVHTGWARTVVTGRARLAGVPVGVLGVEPETVSLVLHADPGLPTSSEQTIMQAGGVWFPDSAAKTAQAIEEFDREGLPLFILANWRGFSGGQRDLFDGILQARFNTQC